MRINFTNNTNIFNAQKLPAKNRVQNKTKTSKPLINFGVNIKPIYAMDREFNIYRYDSETKARASLGVEYSNILSVLKGITHEANGYTFAYAKDVEMKTEDGKIILNPKTIQKMQDELKEAKIVPVYAVDYDGNMQRFSSQAQASRVLNLSTKAINKAAKNALPIAGKYVIIPAARIEKRDENNKKQLDYKTIKTELSRFSDAHNAPICLISYLGEIQRFGDREMLYKKADTNSGTLSNALTSGKSTGRNIAVYENDIILRDEFGKTKKDSKGRYLYDLEKINEKLKIFETAKIKPIKVVDKATGEIMFFDNTIHAQNVLNISKQCIHLYLHGRKSKEYKFEYLYPMNLKQYEITYWS